MKLSDNSTLYMSLTKSAIHFRCFLMFCLYFEISVYYFLISNVTLVVWSVKSTISTWKYYNSRLPLWLHATRINFTDHQLNYKRFVSEQIDKNHKLHNKIHHITGSTFIVFTGLLHPWEALMLEKPRNYIWYNIMQLRRNLNS